jgi:dienelactone hydrolase
VKLGRRATVVALAALLAGSGSALARTIPEPVPELPLLHEEVKAGAIVTAPGKKLAGTAKVVDGNIADWVGTPTGLGGKAVYSRGELVYSDFLFDAYGADDGDDAQRLAVLDPLNEGVPETYRLDPIFQADVPGELGVPTPDQAKADEQYGNLAFNGAADLLELRLAVSGGALAVLARTTSMTAADQTAVVLLFDTVPRSAPHDIPFGAGIHSDTADVAVLLTGATGRAVDLATGAVTPVTTATNPSGWTNAVEAAIPLAALGRSGSRPGPIRAAAATGLADSATGGVQALANVAFRSEPVRTWMDKAQALSLSAGSVEPFFADVDLAGLAANRTDAWHAGPGYFERVFQSSEAISTESGLEGIHQHYGLFIPTAYGEGQQASPMTFWLHWRGGKAHSGAAVSPRIMRDFGENVGGLVVAPRGRGSSSWYLGKGQVDLDEVYADATHLLNVDLDRVYVSGHSMGGWGSWLEAVLHPDRFAAALPVEGPLTQGAWTGADFDGCDDYHYDDYSFCYVQTNDSDARTQHTLRMMANLRNLPIGIYQGGIDELVPVSGVTRQVAELNSLGYQYRYYLFPTYEHYTHPVIDEWAEGARYLQSFTRDAHPAHVTYRRDMPFERSVESGANHHDDPAFDIPFSFDHAYWMSDLTPVDETSGVAVFDGRTFGVAAPPTLTIPEAGGPSSVGQVGPYVMTGQRWLADPLGTAPVTSNGFDVTLTGARAVKLDLAGAALTGRGQLTGKVTSEHPLELRLAGNWKRAPKVLVDGTLVTATWSGGVLVVALPAGTSNLAIT